MKALRAAVSRGGGEGVESCGQSGGVKALRAAVSRGGGLKALRAAVSRGEG